MEKNNNRLLLLGIIANISQIIGVAIQILSTKEFTLSPWIILISTIVGVIAVSLVVLQPNSFTQIQGEKTQRIKQIAKTVLIIIAITFITFEVVYFYNLSIEKKLIVVVANFSEKGNVNDENQTQSLLIYNKIQEVIANEKDIEIIYAPSSLTELSSEAAREVGENLNATIVIWGWYTVRQDNVLINPQLEVLTDFSTTQPLSLTQTVISRTSFEDFVLDLNLSDTYSYISTTVLGTIRYSQNRFSDAINIFSKVIEENKSAESIFLIYNFRGLSYSNNGMHDLAINDYISAIVLEPSSPVLYYNLGSSQLDLNQSQNAVFSFEQAIKLDPSFSPAYNSLGFIYLDEGNLYLAEINFKQAIQLDPSEVIYKSNLADAYFEQGLYDLSLEQVNEGLKSEYSNDYLHLLKSLILSKKGVYHFAAFELFLSLYYYRPTQITMLVILFFSFTIFAIIDTRLKGRISNWIVTKTLFSASSIILKVLRFDKRSSLKNYSRLNTKTINVATLLRYKALLASGSEAKAILFLESCIARGIKDKKLLTDLGVTYFNRDDFDLAYQVFMDVIIFDENNDHACYGLAWIYLYKEKYLDSLKYFKKTTNSKIYGKSSWLSAGDICWKINDTRGAFISWEKAVKKDANFVIKNAMQKISQQNSFLSSAEHYKLGLAYEKMGNKQNAKTGFEMAYKLGLHTPIAQRAKVKLSKL